MSQRHIQEIKMAAARAAIEAAGRERARCLWVLDELLKRAQLGAEKKLLTPVELQVSKVRAEITKTIVIAAKTLILSGAKPQAVSTQPQKPDGTNEQSQGNHQQPEGQDGSGPGSRDRGLEESRES